MDVTILKALLGATVIVVVILIYLLFKKGKRKSRMTMTYLHHDPFTGLYSTVEYDYKDGSMKKTPIIRL